MKFYGGLPLTKTSFRSFLSILLIVFLSLTTISVKSANAATPSSELALNSTVSGIFDSTTTQIYYSVTLPTDGYLNLGVYPDKASLDALTFYDTDGATAYSTGWPSSSGNISWTKPLKAGTYLFRVESNGACNFDLKNTYTPETYSNDQEPNDTTKNAISLNIGETKQGRVGFYGSGSTDSYDFYKVNFSGGKLNISVSPEKSLDAITIFDTDGATAISTGWPSSTGNISWTKPLNAGTYYIRVEANTAGGYEIKASSSSSQRLFGTDRDTTAIAISKSGWPNGASTVVLVRDDDFPDALAGAPLAHKYDAPILLTNPNVLSSDVSNEISRLNPKKIYILGGYGAVSSDIEQQLKNKGIDVIRLKGDSRFGTAAAIAQEVGSQSGKAVITYGYNFPDALSVSSWAASNGVPILLTDSNLLPDETKNVLSQLNITQTIAIGGFGAVSNSVYNQLPSPQRFSGNDRYETNANVLQGLGMDMSNVFIATGENFPDALAGATLAARTNSPIILVNQNSHVNESQYSLINSNKDKTVNIYAFGGTSAVSDDFMNAFSNLLNGN